jgi:ketosteroid isomerase-like protein
MTVDAVRTAATALVAAFGAHDREAYFASFAPSATFVFHNVDHVVASRSDYETLWRSWEADGFKVLACQSSNGVVTMLSADSAVFTHTVRTTVADVAGPLVLGERETIVFQLLDGRWLGVHEHLSIDPTFSV